MWSHYGDSHKGIALRFRSEETNPFFGRAQEVSYQTERPVVNVFTDSSDDLMTKSLLTKADFWSYEEEWRIIDHDTGPGLKQFEPDDLDGVIFGAKIDEDLKNKIEGWIEGKPIEKFQATIDPQSFRVVINAI